MSAREWDCVMERVRQFRDGDRTESEVWHVAPQRGRTEDFCPIRCAPDEGIVLPGPTVRRSPTCSDCLVAVGEA